MQSRATFHSSEQSCPFSIGENYLKGTKVEVPHTRTRLLLPVPDYPSSPFFLHASLPEQLITITDENMFLSI